MTTNPPPKSNFFICADTACRWAFDGSGLPEKLNELVEELEGVRPALEYLSDCGIPIGRTTFYKWEQQGRLVTSSNPNQGETNGIHTDT